MSRLHVLFVNCARQYKERPFRASPVFPFRFPVSMSIRFSIFGLPGTFQTPPFWSWQTPPLVSFSHSAVSYTPDYIPSYGMLSEPIPGPFRRCRFPRNHASGDSIPSRSPPFICQFCPPSIITPFLFYFIITHIAKHYQAQFLV